MIFRGFATRARKVGRLSRLIVEGCILLKMFEDETIDVNFSSELNTDSQVRKHHDDNDTSDIAQNMDILLKEIAAEITITSDAEMEENIESVLKMVSGKGEQTFQGMNVAKKALQVMKEKNMRFTSAYLCKVDKEENKGTIKVVYVYSPYKDDLDGGWVISPRMTGGIKVKVHLPFNSVTLQNKLRSQRCFGYWVKWIDRIALWSPPVCNIAAIALDREIYETNSPSEGQINSDKTHTSDHKETYSSVPAFIKGKWKDCKESERMFAHQ